MIPYNGQAQGVTSSIFSLPAVPAYSGLDPSTTSAYSTLMSSLNSSPAAQAALQAYSEDPRFTQMVAALMERANQSDADITAQADGAYNAQRKVTEAEANKQTTRSLAANGLLPTGGLASQYYNEISAPLFDRLNAQRAQTELDLRNARDNAKQGVTSTLAGLDNNRNQFTLGQLNAQQQAALQRQQLAAQATYQQAQLQQQGQLASQQLAADQARAAQQASQAQAQLDYQRQSDAQNLAFQREQAQLQNQRFYASQQGNGYGNGPAGMTFGGGSSSVFSNEDEQSMQNAYHNNIANDVNSYSHFPVGYQQPGHPTASQSTQSSLGGAGSAAANAANFMGTGMNTNSGGNSAPGMQSIYQNSGITGTLAGGSGWSTPSTTSFYSGGTGSGFTSPSTTSFYSGGTGSGFSSPTSMFYYS